jgi:hypothetical protein
LLQGDDTFINWLKAVQANIVIKGSLKFFLCGPVAQIRLPKRFGLSNLREWLARKDSYSMYLFGRLYTAKVTASAQPFEF